MESWASVGSYNQALPCNDSRKQVSANKKRGELILLPPLRCLHIHNLPSLPVTTWPPKAHCFIPFLPPHVGCQTPYTPTLMHVLRHGHLCRDQTATLPVFNYGFRPSNRAVAIATFKISQHSHPPPPTSKPRTISESTETYGSADSSYDGLGGA